MTARAIIAEVTREDASSCVSFQISIDLTEKHMKKKGRKKGTHGAALSKSFLLNKVIKVTGGINKVAFIGGAIEEIKDGEKTMELLFTEKKIANGLARDTVEHINNV